MRLVAESTSGWDVASRRALAQCAFYERRRVPRTFWGLARARAGAFTRYRVRLSLWSRWV